jgi:hypothetical protein
LFPKIGSLNGIEEGIVRTSFCWSEVWDNGNFPAAPPGKFAGVLFIVSIMKVAGMEGSAPIAPPIGNMALPLVALTLKGDRSMRGSVWLLF